MLQCTGSFFAGNQWAGDEIECHVCPNNEYQLKVSAIIEGRPAAGSNWPVEQRCTGLHNYTLHYAKVFQPVTLAFSASV
jgi:hypothetical protein